MPSACASEAFHHQSGAASRNMRDDGRTTMNFRHDAEVDGKGQVHRRAFFQTEVLGLDEDAVRAQVASPAQFTRSPWYGNIDGGACAMASVEASLHGQIPEPLVSVGADSSLSSARESLLSKQRMHELDG